MFQFGDFASAGEDGRWGDVRWRGRTEAGDEVIVVGRGYEHPAWERAHRSLVHAAIVQAVGRGRTLLENGCGVVVISTEECGFSVVNNSEAEVLAILAELSEQESYDTHKTLVPIAAPDARIVSTDEIAHRLELSNRGTQKVLARLESRRLIHRLGERGGWMLPILGLPVS